MVEIEQECERSSDLPSFLSSCTRMGPRGLEFRIGMDLESLETIARLNAENEYMEMIEEGETEVQGAAQSETQATQTVFQSNKRLKSGVWKEFVSVGVEQYGRKSYCSKKLLIEPSQGTSSLKRHLQCCPKKPKELSEGNQYDHRIDHDMTSEIIIYHDLPFFYVEYEKVRAKDKYLNPNCQHICRLTAETDVFRRYEVEKVKLNKLFAEHQKRVCFTVDMWTARTTMKGYICLTAHFVDDSWRLNNKILA